jgi:DNA-binding transcriptional LysR family regulator
VLAQTRIVGGVLDHRRLSYFLAVAAERSFTRAAQRLHVAQPALSRQVKLLEDELGGPLLVRGGADGVTTTPAGELLVQQAPALLSQLEVLWDAAARLAGGDRGARILRLGYAASSAHGAAPVVLAELRERDPQLTVQARMVSAADALAGLHAGTLDAAILREPIGIDGLASYVVRREPQGLILRAGHPLDDGRPIPMQALDAVPIVIHPRDANPGRFDRIRAACRAAGLDPTFEEPLLAFDPTHGMVRDSDRVTIVSDPGGGLPSGLRWVPLEPTLTLDVVVLTPLVAADPGVIGSLIAAALHVADREGWLATPTATTSATAAATTSAAATATSTATPAPEAAPPASPLRVA